VAAFADTAALFDIAQRLDFVRRQLFLWVDDNYFSRSTTTTL
jgi:hypothetical protein